MNNLYKVTYIKLKHWNWLLLWKVKIS